MTWKAAVKYRLWESKKSILTFFIILMLLTALLACMAVSFTGDTGSVTISISGMEFGAGIFAFVLGITSFRDSFRLMIQNGVSRKTICLSMLVSGLILSGIMSVLCGFLNVLGKWISAGDSNVFLGGAMETLYFPRYQGGGNGLQILMEGILFFFLLFAAVMAAGYFIGVLYYRMNKACKIAVSVGVPGFFLFGLPIFDAVVTHGMIYRGFFEIFQRAYGFPTANPYMGMLTSLAQLLLLSACIWLLVRKAVIKD